jgi:hypothetical protein
VPVGVERMATGVPTKEEDDVIMDSWTRVLPDGAINDYTEYRRQGGRFDLWVWWNRYKDNYK